MDLKHVWEVLVDEEIEQTIPDSTDSKGEGLGIWGHVRDSKKPSSRQEPTTQDMVAHHCQRC